MEKYQKSRGIYNIYKPRYRINALAKSKVWPYKNSRLRRFFTIRAKKLIQGGLFRRFILVFNNLKWTLIRRYIRPYRNKQKPGAKQSRYKTYFYHKQQFLNFYGKIKENNLRNFFQKYLFKSSTNNHHFYVAIENRLDMIFFRLRLLPTIYSCHQLIHHHGLLVNDKLKTSPNYILQIGDIVSIKQKDIFDVLLYNFISKLKQRQYAKFRLKRRIFKTLKKKSYVVRKLYKNKYFQYKIKIFRKFFMLNYYMTNFYKELDNIIFWILKKTLHQIKIIDQQNNTLNVMLNFYLDIFKKLNLLKKKFKTFKTILYSKFKHNLFLLNKQTPHKFRTIKIQPNKKSKVDFGQNNKKKRIGQDFIKTLRKNLKLFIWLYTRKQIKTNLNSFEKFKKPRWILCLFLIKKRKQFVNSLIKILLKKNSNVKQLTKRYFLCRFNYTLFLKTKNKKDIKFLHTIKKNEYLFKNKEIRRNSKFKVELQTFYQKSMLQIFSAYRVLNFLNLKISLYELQFYQNLLTFNFSQQQKNILNKDKYDIFFFKKLLNYEESLLLKKYLYKKYKIDQSFVFFLRRISKKRKLIQEKRIKSYFFVIRNLKKKRRAIAPRLKKVHWFVPKYLYFNFYTLRCLVIKQTSSKDVHFAFKSSLKKLYIFYKSLSF